ncbi:CIC11C00000005635 [Sungouiella intermedia]|uniref:CIC11C00000005635 n=1 Tax=Sungouiella intermedia TaxID=45354 RepID=A0A1L0BJ12_9ASCO|nr:CIC11C00000005635 [[Candida] intermedia]
MLPAVSGCGTYIALVKAAELQIHMLLPSKLFRDFNLSQCFIDHRSNLNHPPHRPPITVHSLEWEDPVEDKCGKIAVHASDASFHLILVFDFTEDSPVVIEMESEGISHLQWIPGASVEGSYSNCSQLAVFSELATELRVYSLDCTVVEFTLPKPISNSLILRPGDHRTWSVVAAPYYEKNLAMRLNLADLSRQYPSLLHFLNNGSTSDVLASLQLDFSPNESASFTWSPSGKWLLYFDDSISGYKLKVYNSLGIHSQHISSMATHLARPTLEYSSGTDELATEWISTWGSIEGVEYVAVAPQLALRLVHLKAYAVNEVSATRRLSTDLSLGTNWVLQTDSEGSGSYKRHKGALLLGGKWKTFQMVRQKLLLATDNFVAILLVKIANPLHFEVECTASASLMFLQAYLLSDMETAVVFSDNLALLTPQGARVLATSRYRFKRAHFLLETDSTTITLIEETTSGPVWRQIIHRDTTDSNDDSNLEIMKQFDYKEDNSKVVKLMKDVQRREWGIEKREPEDITDTFHLTSKRRRSAGAL